tara:strand:+ start:2828 stop:5404 length:2577 start_codon:yes stop_codon:yes gene_type:complete
MSDVTVRFRGDTRQLERSVSRVDKGLTRLNRNAKQSNKALAGMAATSGRVTTALRVAGAALVAFGTSRAIGGIVGATTAMEGFRTQLTTYLGSQEMANSELERLSKLARSLPQEVSELTEAFVIFNRFGIDTSNESMVAFSNIAAANSKSITQLGEAVADALTGEFERLKEFGIKVTKENGKFTARIGEDQVAVSESASELVNQLRALGEEGGRFGNVTIGALTLAISNFQGAMFEAQAAVGDAGFGAALADTVNKITDFINNNDQLIQQISRGLTMATLAAGDAFIFLLNNLDLVIFAFAALLGIGVAKFFLSMSRMILAVTIPAFTGLFRVVKGVAAFLLRGLARTALVGVGIAFSKVGLIIAGIATVATAVGFVLNKVFGVEMPESVKKGAEFMKDKITDLKDTVLGFGDDVLDTTLDVTGLNDIIEKGSDIVTDAGQSVFSYSNYLKGLKDRTDDYIHASKKKTEGLSEEELALMRTRKEEEQKRKVEENRIESINKFREAQFKTLRKVTGALDLELSLLNETEAVRQAHLNTQKAVITFREKNTKATDEEIAQYKKEILEIELLNAKKKEQLAVEKEFVAFRRQSTELEQAQAGLGAINRLDPAFEQQKNYEDALAGIEEARKRGIIDEKTYHRTLERLNREHSQRMLGIRKDLAREQLEIAGVTNSEIIDAVMKQMDAVHMIQQGGVQAAQGTLSAFGNILGQMSGQNKKAFEAYKALQIAQALISTYSAAAKAIAFPPGPPISLLYVAGAIAAGMAQVNAIRSQQYTGRQLGGAVQMGQTYVVGETGPELFTPGKTGRVDQMPDMGKNVNVTFNINAVDASGFDELLIDRRGTIQQIITDAMLERGGRSGF